MPRANVKITVLAHHTGNSLPAASEIIYLCLKCGTSVPSMPRTGTSCRCGNVHVDPGAARGGASDERKLLILSVRCGRTRSLAKQKGRHET
jgi:hypothetical protein